MDKAPTHSTKLEPHSTKLDTHSTKLEPHHTKPGHILQSPQHTKHGSNTRYTQLEPPSPKLEALYTMLEPHHHKSRLIMETHNTSQDSIKGGGGGEQLSKPRWPQIATGGRVVLLISTDDSKCSVHNAVVRNRSVKLVDHPPPP